MATHQSAIKRNRQNEVRKLRNRSVKSYLRSRIKKVIEAVNAKDQEKAQATLKEAIPVIDKAASKGVIHNRTASRSVSRLTTKVNAFERKRVTGASTTPLHGSY